MMPLSSPSPHKPRESSIVQNDSSVQGTVCASGGTTHRKVAPHSPTLQPGTCLLIPGHRPPHTKPSRGPCLGSRGTACTLAPAAERGTLLRPLSASLTPLPPGCPT